MGSKVLLPLFVVQEYAFGLLRFWSRWSLGGERFGTISFPATQYYDSTLFSLRFSLTARWSKMPSAMPPKAGYSTPILHVADVARSIRFYELLGFETVDTQGEDGSLGWARLQCDGGALMFLLAEEPVDASAQSFLLAMYTPDLPGLRKHLLANGVKVSPITHPEYMPSGQITLADPDGYIVGINHWGDAEHKSWLKSIEKKKSAKKKSASRRSN